MQVLVGKERRVSLFLAQERRKDFYSSRTSRAGPQLSGPRPGWIVTRWRTFQNSWSARTGEVLPLPTVWTHEKGLPTEARIPGLWDTSVPFISGTYANTVCLSLPQHGLGEPVSVPRCGIGTGCFTGRLEGQGHGSRMGIGLTSRDFGDLRACLRHYTSN